MTSRKSDIFFAYIFACGTVLALFAGHSVVRVGNSDLSRRGSSELVRTLGLTDLCLFTEARYTRHPSQADHHAAFQDHPLALEHFPAGSLVMPPRGKFRMQN